MTWLIAFLVTMSALQRPDTLGAALLQRNLPAPKDAADLEQPITSYSVLDDERGFVIAYYGVEADGMLHELRVRSYDRQAGAWRSARFPEPIGSVLSVKRSKGFLFLSGHSSPSAAPLLVLTESLDLKRTLDGWSELALDDGRVIFTRSMIHFSPTHAEVLALYDPATDRETNLYPDASVQNHRGGERDTSGLWIDRWLSEPTKGASPGTIEFTATVQRMRLNQQQVAQPAGSEERFRVRCDVTANPPACRRIE